MRVALLALLLCAPLASASLLPASTGPALPSGPLAGPAPVPMAATQAPLAPALPHAPVAHAVANPFDDPVLGAALRSTPGYRSMERLKAMVDAGAVPASGDQATQSTAPSPPPATAADVALDGLQSGWMQAFLGLPTILRTVDLDGDGGTDVLAGTDTGVVAVDGKTWAIRWARPIGSPVVGLEVDASAKPARIAVATAYGGRPSEAMVLEADDGGLAWRVGLPSGATGLGLAGGDLLVATYAGAVRLAGTDGSTTWAALPAFLPGEYTPVAWLSNGAYLLSAFGDLSGDGVPDVVLARTAFVWATVPYASVDGDRAELHALDGATGAPLWIHVLGGEPHRGGATMTLSDLDLLDTRGDGTLDAAVTGSVFRYDAVPLAAGAYSFESFLRVTDGTATAIASLPVGHRGLVSPVLQAELFLHLDHTDAGAGKGDEAAVVRYSLAGLLLGTAYTVERYAMPDEGSGAMVLVSDVAVPVGDIHDLAAPAGGAGARDLVAIGAEAVRVKADGTEAGRRALDVTGFATLDVGGATVLGTLTGLAVTGPDLQATTAELPLHGSIRAVARVGAGPGGFVAVSATDGALHVLDGARGTRLARHPMAGLGAIHATGDLLMAELRGDDVRIEALRLPAAEVAWNVTVEDARTPAWFDGNGDGTDDVLAAYDAAERTLRALDGATGKPLWASELEEPISRYAAAFAVPRAGGGHDLALEEYGELRLLDGATGKLLWTDADGDWPECMGAGDLTDGKIVTLAWGTDGTDIVAYARDGKSATAKMTQVVTSCNLLPVAGGFVLAAGVYGDDGVEGRLARYDGTTAAWSLPVPGSAKALAIDAAADRGYFSADGAFETRSLSSGSLLGSLPLGLAATAIVHDLDGAGTMDLLVHTPDGLLRALGRDLVLPDGAAPMPLTGPEVLPDGVLPGGDPALPQGGDGPGDAPPAGEHVHASPAPDAIVATLALAFGVLVARRRKAP